MAATISHLQHACLTAPWAVRVASVQALAKVHAHALPRLLLCLWRSTASHPPQEHAVLRCKRLRTSREAEE